MSLDVVGILEQKRDGLRIHPEALEALIAAYVRGDVPDYQMSAFLMAAAIQGLDFQETVALTGAMLHSGIEIGIPTWKPLVDKHSTGGVGDKTSLVAVPLLAALGFAVPKLSGRGLGHTGGTLDKLESIPGFRTALAPQEFAALVGRFGLAVAAQTAQIVPADQRLYALRDVTGTVQSLPLIAASIMSKKLAVSSRLVLLDVKVGDGAFFPDAATAKAFAELAIAVGRAFGRATRALLTAMDAPLGRTVGNALEVREAIDCLRGEGPADLREVVLAIAAEALSTVHGMPQEEAMSKAEAALDSGEAFVRFRRFVQTQGGDARVIDDPDLLPRAARTREIRADSSGYVQTIRARQVGDAARRAGAGRLRKEDAIDLGAGIEILHGVGERVEKGDGLLRLHAASEERLDAAEERLRGAIALSESPPQPQPLILGRALEPLQPSA